MEPAKNDGFVVASFICGVLALLTICTGVLPLVFGSLGILFAVLSRRRGEMMPTLATCGTVFSGMGIAVGALLVILSLAMLPKMMQDSTFRAQLEQTYKPFENIYGMDFEEFMSQYY